MSISEAAHAWRQSGVSVVPILTNGTKRPAVQWAEFQAHAPTLGQVDAWWSNGREFGLALICGHVSGNLEMLELEARACTDTSDRAIQAALDEMGAREIWECLCSPEGYLETSPSGGLHLLYRVSDHPVPGNTKIAQDEDRHVLVETRGEGGYVIAAPTTGLCHPSGKPWQLVMGEYGKLPTITWEQRELLHAALRKALDCSPAPATTVATTTSPGSVTVRGPGASITPGDDFEARVDWADILRPHEWTLESTRGRERYWTRPDKDRRDGASATTGRDPGRDRLYVFSTSTIFEPERSYTKFGAYALLNFGGDHAAAARELARLRFGERRDPAEGIIAPETPTGVSPKAYSLDEVGNAQRLWDRVRGKYHYIAEEKRILRWDGRTWIEDFDGALTRQAIACTEDMDREARTADDDHLARWAKSSRSRSKLNATTELMRSMPGATRRIGDFDPHRHLVNLRNGVLNLRTGELVDHDSSLLMTRMLNASYDPDARCPEFEKFMAAVLPDETMRSYVQRALGYSLLGDVDQRAMFLIYGPPGTGKSTLLETIREIFGDYATTAAAGTFRGKGRDSAPTNDLHDLRGKRFVITSETAEHATYDEDTLKRLTGRDRIRTRELYQSNQEWIPQCVLWIATNHPPKFSSDDDAVWCRTKLVPFLTQFTGESEVPDLSRNVLVPEADGILNWLLAGLRDYQARGLGEPEEVRQAAKTQRRMSDPVARFLEEKIGDGILIDEQHQQIRAGELHLMYQEWSRVNGERTLGGRRFNNRAMSLYPHWEQISVAGQVGWRGVGKSAAASLLGTMTVVQLPDP